jgi:hypothetical protein
VSFEILRNEIDLETGTVIGQDTALSIEQQASVRRLLPDPNAVVFRDPSKLAPPDGLKIPEMNREE